MAPTLRDIRQREAIRAFIRLGGIVLKRRGKGSHCLVVLNGNTLVIPGGTISIGTMKGIIKNAGVTEQEFLDQI